MKYRVNASARTVGRLTIGGTARPFFGMTPDAAHDILICQGWYAGLPPELQKAVIGAAQIRRRRSANIFDVGDAYDGMYAVLSGEVQIAYRFEDGRFVLLVAATAGTWFGETGLFDRQPRDTEAAITKPGWILHVGATALDDLTRDSVERYAAFARLLSERYRLRGARLASLSMLPVTTRVAQVLRYLSRPSARESELQNVVISQEMLAAMVGATRQTINKSLQALARNGAIKIGYGKIEVLNAKALGTFEEFADRIMAPRAGD